MHKVLLIDNFDSFTYNLLGLLKQIKDVQVNLVKNNEPYLLGHIQEENILISPGPDLPTASGNLMQCINNNLKTKNFLGICLGHQALAQALGAQLYQMQRPMHGQFCNINIIHKSKIFNNIPQPLQAGLYHSWAINKQCLVPCMRVTSHCNNNVIMSFEHTHLPIYGVQFHPESYMCNMGLQLIKNWLN